jgi:hypothetical protein
VSFKDVFEINQIRCEIAFRKTLKHWASEAKLFGVGCPHCNSLNFKKYSVEKGKQRYICQECKRRFNERPSFECSCVVPGKRTVCQTCPRFQEFLATLRQHIDALRVLNRQELQILSEQEVLDSKVEV